MGGKRYFYRRVHGYLCLAQEGLADFPGDAIATSTNRRLEGTFRRNWWGFAGRRSADASLHERAGPELLRSCHAVLQELPAGHVLTTHAGPRLSADHVLHTVVPSHPAGRDPRPLPEEQAADFAQGEEQALDTLDVAYKAILRRAGQLKVGSLACPAIGSGCRGYPVRDAAEVGLRAILEDDQVPYVEIRFWAQNAFTAWIEECKRRDIPICDEQEVADMLWEGESLAKWREKQRIAVRDSCPIL